jgi:dTDP-4-amino-4,6-dideoxygalactose transaminase
MDIPVTKAIFGEEEVEAVRRTLESGWVVQGPRVAEFESAWSTYTAAPYSRATTSCTTALHLALLGIGIQPGDEVIVPAFTWIATANAVEYCGATPIFCDIDLRTFCIDVGQIESKITAKTKAIMPVHQFGLAADMATILSIAARYSLLVIEDCACAAGTYYQGQHVGIFGEIGCFSFHPRKAITTGEGGMLVTRDQRYVRLFEIQRAHGAEINDLARHQANSGGFILPEFRMLGYNYRMTDIQAAIGIEQLKRLDGILLARRARAERYTQALGRIENLQVPYEPQGYRHGFQSYTLLMQESHEKRNQVGEQLQQCGIATRQGTHSVPALAYYKSRYALREADYPRAMIADRQSMTLPLYATMTDEEQDYVIHEFIKAMK